MIAITADYETCKTARPRINPGDEVRIEMYQFTSEKDISLLRIGDRILFAHIKRMASGIWIVHENNAYLPEFFAWEDIESLGLYIYGRVTEVISHYE